MLTADQIAKVKNYIIVYDSSMLVNDNLDFVINDSAESLSATCFDTQYEKAIAYLTMHTLTIASQTADGSAGEGAVVEKTIGPITIRWANPSEVSKSNYWDMYKTTKYGRMLLDLIKACSLGAGISVTGAWRLL